MARTLSKKTRMTKVKASIWATHWRAWILVSASKTRLEQAI